MSVIKMDIDSSRMNTSFYEYLQIGI